jgi:hypothetical protein
MKSLKERQKEINTYIHSKNLNCSDFNSTITIYHSDTSVFKFEYAKMEEKDGFVCVWTEHNGYHFWEDDVLIKIEMSREIYGDQRNIKTVVKDFFETNRIKEIIDIYDRYPVKEDEGNEDYSINELLRDCYRIIFKKEK